MIFVELPLRASFLHFLATLGLDSKFHSCSIFISKFTDILYQMTRCMISIRKNWMHSIFLACLMVFPLHAVNDTTNNQNTVVKLIKDPKVIATALVSIGAAYCIAQGDIPFVDLSDTVLYISRLGCSLGLSGPIDFCTASLIHDLKSLLSLPSAYDLSIIIENIPEQILAGFPVIDDVLRQVLKDGVESLTEKEITSFVGAVKELKLAYENQDIQISNDEILRLYSFLKYSVDCFLEARKMMYKIKF